MRLSSEIVFKLALLVTVACALILSYFTGNYYGEITRAMEWHGYGSIVPDYLTTVFAVLWILIPLLLFRFSRKARSMYLIMVISGLGISLVSGVSAFTEFEMFLVNLSLLADGVILTLAYTSLTERFELSADNRTEIGNY